MTHPAEAVGGYRDYGYTTAGPSTASGVLLPGLLRMCGPLTPGMRVLDVGCGAGYMAGQFLERGCKVVGLDLSEKGIALAREAYPTGRFETLPADDKILENLDEEPFDLVISTEVVEHLYSPRPYIQGCFSALRPGGLFVCSTPYHGYFKNLAVALLGKFDDHFTSLWDGGHIKFWSRKTLSALLAEGGFANLHFCGVGRITGLWMSMIMAGTKPV